MMPTIMKQGKWTPWLYLLPAILIMLVFIAYPTVQTVVLSFMDRSSSASAATTCSAGKACWGIFENYRYALTGKEMTLALRNNALWLILMVPATIAAGLLFAILAERVKYERIAKSIIFMPMAISFIGAGIIWQFVYSIRFGGGDQIGLLNAIIMKLGGQPVAWMSNPSVNNFALMLVGVWLWAGFCMTILSAALKNIPEEVIEASHVDGASDWQTFWRITIPLIMPTILVVTTTMIINVLKIFDIVFVMTGGNFGTEVIANRMFKLIVTDTGRSMALAVILIILTVPIMIVNIRRFKKQEEMR